MKPLSPERMLLHIRPLVTVNYSAKNEKYREQEKSNR